MIPSPVESSGFWNYTNKVQEREAEDRDLSSEEFSGITSDEFSGNVLEEFSLTMYQKCRYDSESMLQ